MSKIKTFIQLFVPPMYYKVKKRLFPKKEQPYHPLPKIEHTKSRMVIVGTGPSLNKTIELYESQIHEADCMMVNFSANTPLFEKIKPRYYTMADPGWIRHNPMIDESIHNCVNAIVAKTQWPMIIVLPSFFKSWWAIDEFKKNPNIIVFFDGGSWQQLPDELLFPAFDENKATPPTNTVLSLCLYLSLYWGYKETYLVGADTTFTQMAYVGQKDNVLYTVDAHYYNNNDVCQNEVDVEKQGRPYGIDMEQYLEMCHGIFFEYKLMSRYAKWKDLNIYNASEYSMIDCFERKKLGEKVE